MLKSVHGIYRQGKVELVEQPTGIPEEAEVIVTFLEDGSIDLKSRGISSDQAAELRSRLASFTEDWESPEMAAYDNYDANRRS